MKPALHKLFLLAGGAALVLLTGCPKTPRPVPTDTTAVPPMGNTPITYPPPPVRQDPPFKPEGTELGLIKRPDIGTSIADGDRTLLAAQTVYFDFDQSAIKASERAKLKAAKEYLDQHPEHRLALEGHCDWRGTAEYNLALGDRRANSAKKYLQSLGVAADRLDTVSKGNLEAAKNGDDATLAKDRRVDLVVVAGASGGAVPGVQAPGGPLPTVPLGAPPAARPRRGGAL
ncbi:MAG TPA: OmpA family protein [Opitutaceae bacterium]|nr:OmpA family protein [Opitutaceae bacterium]